MTGIVDWAAARARMVMAFILLSLVVGGFAYWQLPKEGEPDIEIPALFVSVAFPGISAADSESLLVKPMETELRDLDGLTDMGATAAEGYAGVSLEFEFGWDKTKIMADVRDAMSRAEAKFPAGAEQYSINEINFSEFPIVIVNLTGPVPERTMARLAKDLQDRIEGLDAVLEAGLAGNRDEMLEVLIDPLRLESYNVTAGELISVVQNNNQLIAAGEVETDTGAFAVKIPSSFDTARGRLRPAGQGERRPDRHAGRSRDDQPHLRGPHRHRALQRRDNARAAGGQAQGLQPHRHRRRDRARRGRDPRDLARRAEGRGRDRHVERPVPAGRLDGQPARGLGADGHRAGDDRGARGARHAPGAAGRLRHPDLVPAVLRLPRAHGRVDLEHRDVRPDPRRRHAGRRRHRGRRIRRQAHRRGRSARCMPMSRRRNACSGRSSPRPRRRSAPSCRCCSGPASRASSWGCCRSR